MGIFQQFPYSNFHEMNLDQIIKIMKQMQDEWENTKSEWSSYKDFIDNYFETLDLSQEVLDNLRAMITSGEMDPVIDPVIVAAVAAWLAEHITPTTPAIDDTLSVQGAAADAKATGDAIRDLGDDLNSKLNALGYTEEVGTNILDPDASLSGYNINSSSPGEAYADANYTSTGYLEVEPGERYSCFGVYNGNVVGLPVARVVAYDANMAFVSYLGNLAYSTTTPNYVTIPVGAKYIRMSLTTSNYTSFGVPMVAKTDGTAMPAAVVAYNLQKYLTDYAMAKVITQDYSSLETYALNDCVLYKGGLYICITPIPAPEEWDPEQWLEISMNDVLNNYKAVWTKLTGTVTAQKYIPSSGVISDISPSNYTVRVVNAVAGKPYMITGQAYRNSYYYVFYDSANNFISGHKATADGTTTITEKVIAPSNAVTLAVASTSGNDVIETITGIASTTEMPWIGKKWTAVGDSLTEVNDKTTKNYCDYIIENTGIDVVNMGVSGAGYMRKHDTNQAFYDRIADVPSDSDVVTIFGSLNDLGGGLTLGTIDDDISDNTVFGYVNGTLDALYTAFPTVNIGIISPTPWKSSEPWNENNGSTQYCEGLKQICYNRGIPFLDLYHCSNLRPWDATARDLFYSHDIVGGVNAGCHPDENGHKMFAPKVKNFLESLLL